MTETDDAPSEPHLRRRTLAGAGAAGIALAAMGTDAGLRLWQAGERGGDDLPPVPDREVHLQIVAHPDDCLYFVNPRLADYVASGSGLVTVVLTAGEANGYNGHGVEGAPDFPGYTAARDTGLRRAYSLMATGRDDTPWHRTTVSLDSGPVCECWTLEGHPAFQIVFFSLWTNLGRLTQEQVRLMELWEERRDNMLVLPPEGSDLGDGPAVERRGLLDSLVELLDHYRPVSVNTLDLDPDYSPEEVGAAQEGYSDHIDHTAAGLFAWQALSEWSGSALADTWRGYYNRHWPSNLGEDDREVKGDALNVYAWKVGDCDFDWGCGDKVVKEWGVGDTYGPATHPRYPDNLAMVRTGEGERFFATRSGRLQGDARAGGSDLDGPHLLPGIAAAGGRLFAVSLGITPRRDEHSRDLLAFDAATREWENLANPVGAGEAARQVGMPAAASDGERTLLAVRHPEGGTALRFHDGKGWGPWEKVDGDYQHQTPAAVEHGGRFTVLRHNDAGIDRIDYRPGGGTSTEELRLPLPGMEAETQPSSALAAAVTEDGRLALACRGEGGSDILVFLETDDGWKSTRYLTEGGLFAPVLAASHGRLALAADVAGGKAAAILLDPDEIGHGDASDRLAAQESTALAGRPLLWSSRKGFRLAAFGSDGRLHHSSVEAGESQFPDMRQWVEGADW
ncbi:PIG-L family deacetylase [Salininema proteolyticum]|uniref:GlcNAc-PI de-N-acetylase n=1 Tax=Salininema proteolyticum TaxID=1607685 RepID=A0ABV8TWW4_9ACTN